jgi:hypothetical protein
VRAIKLGDNGTHHGSHLASFTEKNRRDHLLEYSRFLPDEGAAFIALVISLWAVTEIVQEFTENRIPLRNLVLPVLGISLVIVFYKAYVKYRTYVPDSLKEETRRVQEIFWKQRCGWQFALARQIIEDRIRDDEEALSRMKSGAEYVHPRKLELSQYMAWLRYRPEALSRLLEAVAMQCTSELPTSLASAKAESDVEELKRRSLRLADLYKQARKLEEESHEIVPPDALRRLHETTFGWTDPVRSGVARFLEIADELASLDRRRVKAGDVELPLFVIPFDPPEVLEDYSRMLEEVDLSDLESD